MYQIVALLVFAVASLRTPFENRSEASTSNALIGALRAYDAMIASLEWRAICFQPGFERGGGWTMSDHSIGGFDDVGRWYMQSQQNDSPTADSIQNPDFFVGFRARGNDPSRMLYYDLTHMNGKVAGPVQPQFTLHATPMNMLGRRSDLELDRSLAELLATGDDLKLWSSPDHPGLPGVQAMATHGVHRMRFQVVLDPEHGYAPRAFRSYRPDDGTPMEYVEVIRYAQIDGIWIASVALRTTYLTVDITPGSKQAEYFQKHKERLDVLPRLLGVNIPDDLRAEIAAVMPRMMDHGPVPGEPNEIYAPMGAGMTKGAYTPLLLFVTPRSINKPLDPLWLNGPMRQDATLYDFTRDRRCTVAEAAEPPMVEREVSP